MNGLLQKDSRVNTRDSSIILRGSGLDSKDSESDRMPNGCKTVNIQV
jgi:hypothetical protein